MSPEEKTLQLLMEYQQEKLQKKIFDSLTTIWALCEAYFLNTKYNLIISNYGHFFYYFNINEYLFCDNNG